jgi:hypothetical protein
MKRREGEQESSQRKGTNLGWSRYFDVEDEK